MAGGANRAWTDESTLIDPRYDDDPRVQLLRNPCPRCHASRGQYCRTKGNGMTTLHKARREGCPVCGPSGCAGHTRKPSDVLTGGAQ